MRLALVLGCWVTLVLLVSNLMGTTDAAPLAEGPGPAGAVLEVPWHEIMPPSQILLVLVLVGFSAFFSASEIAFFSLHRLRLRSMRASENALERLAARMMDHPGNLLTSILMANSIVNVLLSIALAAPFEELVRAKTPLPEPASYAFAVVFCTGVLVMFGEILPKVFVVRLSEAYVRFAAVPVLLTDRLLMPLRDGLILFLGFFFQITGFSRVRPAPFITDDEFKSLLSEGEASGVIEKDERVMIQGILEFSDVMVREILIPRPDMIAIKETATVEEALHLFRAHEYARMPMYRENLDQITGVIYAKDLLPIADTGDLQQPIRPLARRAHFVPETMSVADFVKTVQRLRTHLAIVVDEFGGTEGLVTLQDALREVIGDFGDEDEEKTPPFVEISKGVYRADGSLPLYEMEALTGVPVNDEEHATAAGFIMAQIDKIPEAGDHFEHLGVMYTVEKVEGKRVEQFRIEVPEPLAKEAQP